MRREGFVNAKGRKVFHDKTEERYANGQKHGQSVAWNEAGDKTVKGHYSRGSRQGKWTTFRKGGAVASEEM